MKFSFNNFSNIRLFRKIAFLIVFLSVLFAHGVGFASVPGEGAITRGEFIEMLAKNHPENSLLPKNHSQLSKQALYMQVASSLKKQGINVLDNKPSLEALSQQEFVRITYAFAGGPKNSSLFEQKLFLKNAEIISSTDIGLTTGVDGKVFQTHKGETDKKQTELAAPIFMEDKFETDDTSKALFTFDDQSTLTMSEDTVININKHIYNPDQDIRETLVKASLGWVRFKVTKKLKNGSFFKVVTPTAIAGVRGTEFAVFVNPKGKTTFVVLEGQIETWPILPNGEKGKAAFISAGEFQDISQNGAVTAVAKASPGLLNTVINKTTKPKKLTLPKGIAKELAKSAAKISAKTASLGFAQGTVIDSTVTGVKDSPAVSTLDSTLSNVLESPVVSTLDSTLSNVLESPVVSNLDSTLSGLKESPVASVKGSAMPVVKDTAVSVAKDSAVAAAKDSAVSAAKDSAVAAAKDSAVSAAKDSAVAAAKDSAVAAAKDSAVSAAKDSAVAAAKDSAVAAAKDSAVAAAKDSAVEAAKDSAVAAAKDAATETVKQIIKETLL
ncbi:MAG: hypothetical protein NPINA01_09410 [Nitrospinaceae bacterium]|nr:MAG: hypothetical protein NPINA01_09410 [Nitrospinaceae bacterium]